MKILAIWICGLLASAIIAGLIVGRMFDDPSGGLVIFFGAPAGMLSFACIRLWLA